MKSSLTTTISSGRFKGKKLFLPSLNTTRSTKSIVKESFFSAARQDIVGKVFIEVFGGSALMAAEALSNYAAKAYAVELDRDSYKFTKKNIDNLNDQNILAINADTFKITPQIVNENDDIVLYIDPPFDIRDGFGGIYERVWDMISALDKSKIFLIVLEHISTYNSPDSCAGFSKFKSRKFGKTTLSYYKQH
ncbi:MULTISPECIES: 16S rRNA (guanine(966)-N(2))-methyltransferase RsmD [Campylobacter]|nr:MULTISPECIES: 16S rRNA (guanine(966)-N(2))-methyltransferase RsmD [Campylobacter]AHE93449.1 RNA methyltransferase, RsmD family [Campylobacter fetus subsp. venerealis cfvi03/293]AIR78057.1 RNA methyltransferase, RsmD family [Campylobacter fetus subsp. fetus 04/554]AIR79772.1 RNA methyltransferase, RsmD family [Campylobacter fetus subsp. venerealis 97/608]MDV2489959.1 16S rRNA (guanine(966)-N(2))-methyltransferase RsmD [Campylobacter sp. TJR-1]QEL44091.1 RNA methyltransferase, RsmD family [Ca